MELVITVMSALALIGGILYLSNEIKKAEKENNK